MPMTVEQQPDAQAQSWVRNQLEAASVATAYRLADLYAISDIECNGVAVKIGGQRWYDIAPMFDPREVSGEMIDICSQLVAYALGRNLFVMHSEAPNLLRKVVQS